MRGYEYNYEASRERKAGQRVAKMLQKRADEHLALRKAMREYFKGEGTTPPESISKLIGWRTV